MIILNLGEVASVAPVVQYDIDAEFCDAAEAVVRKSPKLGWIQPGALLPANNDELSSDFLFYRSYDLLLTDTEIVDAE